MEVDIDGLEWGLTEREALLYSVTEEGWIHISWKTVDNGVVVIEHTSANYPSIEFYKFENIDSYYDAIEGSSWLLDMVRYNDDRIGEMIDSEREE